MSALPSGWARTTVGEIARPEYGKGLPANKRNDSGSVPLIGSAGVLAFHDTALVNEPVVIVGRKGNAAVHLSPTPRPDRHDLLLRVPRGVDRRVHGPTDVDRGSPRARFFDGDSESTATRSRERDFRPSPFAEQRRIVAVIEEQFSRLDDVEHALRNVQLRALALTRAATRRAFIDQWPEVQLVGLTPEDRPICYGILMPKQHVEDGVLYVRVRDFPPGQGRAVGPTANRA